MIIKKDHKGVVKFYVHCRPDIKLMQELIENEWYFEPVESAAPYTKIAILKKKETKKRKTKTEVKDD